MHKGGELNEQAKQDSLHGANDPIGLKLDQSKGTREEGNTLMA